MNTLTLTSLVTGRERGAWRRLVGIAAGVAVGVALLLLVLAAYSALGERSARSTWALPHFSAETIPAEGTPTDDTVFVAVHGNFGSPGDYFSGQRITRIAIAATPKSTIEVPGIGTPPAPGEFFASPALAELIKAAPSDELADRYGTPAGIIDRAGLIGPEQLLVVVGEDAEKVTGMLGAVNRDELTGYSYPNLNYQIIAIVGGFAVLFPVTVLIAIVTKLGQAARTERFSTIRLIGAKPRLVARIATVESFVPALGGSLVGVVLFYALRPIAALLPVEGTRFFVTDLNVAWPGILAVALGTAALAAVVAYVTALRSELGPLGGSREQRERAPRIASLIPLALGTLVIVAPAISAKLGLVLPFHWIMILGGFVLITVGLVLAGPYLAWLVSRAGAARVSGAAGLLAMSRISRHPRATFRSVSGLVLALFVVTLFAVGTTTETRDSVVDAPASEIVPPDTLMLNLIFAEEPGSDGNAHLLAPVADTPGVERVIIADWFDGDETLDGGFVLDNADARALGLTPGDGARTWVEPSYFDSFPSGGPAQTEAISEADAALAYPSMALVMTDGSAGALERARTAVSASEFPVQMLPTTRAEQADVGETSFARQYAGLAWIGILIATLISVVSLTVSTIAGMIDRKRVLGLLRLSGMPTRTLRRMIVVETVLPLATVFLVTIGLGFATAWGIVVGLSTGERNVTMPDTSYLGLLALCFGLAAAAVLVVLRSVRSELPLAATRFE
ncbi:hypothetical protein ACI1US_02608 [Leucobacter sp. BZR 635]